MNFVCKLCQNSYFPSNDQAIAHLKRVHKCKEKVDQIPCTVKESKCGKYFQTYHGLERHIPKCLDSFKIQLENELETSVDIVTISENNAKNQNSYVFEFSEDEINLSTMDEVNPVKDLNNSLIYGEAAEGGRQSSFVLNSSNTEILSCG